MSTFCITSSLYYPHMGGIEAFTQHVAHELAALGHRAIVVTNRIDDSFPPYQREEDIDVFRLPCSPLMGARFPAPSLVNNAQTRDMWRAIDGLYPDYYLINARFYPLSIAAAKHANAHGIRPVVLDHGSAHLTVGNNAADIAVQHVEHTLTSQLKHYDVDFYAISQASAHWLHHFDIEAAGVISNAIDADIFCQQTTQCSRDFRAENTLAETDFTVAFTGRFSPEKGIASLLESARILSEKAPDVHFLLAGTGPLEQNITQANLPNVHNLGKLTSSEISALLQTCDAFCLPTRSEGFSTSLLEAAACGCTPIITHVGGVDELMPSAEYGYILPDTKPETIAKAVIEVRDNAHLRKNAPELLRAHVRKHYSWKTTAQTVIAACQSAQERSQ